MKEKCKIEEQSYCFAIFKMPFMHRLTQSMAENTYYRSRGKNIVKVKIDTNNSRTLKQQQQRAKMRTLIPLCKALNDFSAWNAFVSLNVGHVSVTEDLEVTVDYENLLVAEGSLEMLEDITVTADAETHSLLFSHAAEDYGYGSEPTDVLHAVVLEKGLMRSRMFTLNTRSESEPVSVEIPEKWDMENLEVYVFFLSEDGRKASDSFVSRIPVAPWRRNAAIFLPVISARRGQCRVRPCRPRP